MRIVDLGGEQLVELAFVVTEQLVEASSREGADVYLVARSFGFETAVDVDTEAIKGAHNEAQGYPHGIGLIKLMGRHSGFIAATAALAIAYYAVALRGKHESPLPRRAAVSSVTDNPCWRASM